ncbi:MAG: hypothetical protein ABIL09_00090 [Gemmatimonadota bacterium]
MSRDRSAARGLRGLKGLFLVVESIDGSDALLAMTERLLREDAEVCLRRAGLAPVGAGQWLASTGTPHLYVRVDLAEGPAGGELAGFAVSVQVREQVSLARSPGVTMLAPVWTSQRVAAVPRGELPDGIRESVGVLLDRFAAEYEGANAA